MLVKLKFFNSSHVETVIRRGHGLIPDGECYQEEMAPEEFALRFAAALRADPRLNTNEKGEYIGNAPVFAFIFKQDPERFKGRGLEKDRGISYEPKLVRMREVAEGKLIQVTIGAHDSDEHFFFRVSENGLKYIPYAEECGVTATSFGQRACGTNLSVDQRDPAWPWAALYPEKFARLAEFCEFIEPDDENPLTGLSASKDGPTRTCAKQVIARLKNVYDQWARDIVAAL